ncbi:MAG TPA: rhamnan synthesis F family protein [Acetobacteraceae bacterium]|nr:rhamnan synthesis F family protein [Acetobacteraceae bacterium]
MTLASRLARIARPFLRALRDSLDAVLASLGVALASLDRRPTIRSISPLREERLGREIALFCHFDRAGRIRTDLRLYLKALAHSGLGIIFVSNAPRLPPEEMLFLQDHCAGVVLRRNRGFDFGAWKDALLAYGLPRPETKLLILANDSLYGPLRPLGPVLAAIDFAQADLWALTDSWQHRYHLQSYFLAAGPRVLESIAWKKFWRGLRPLACKRWVIRRFEIGLSQAMLRAGFRLRAVWPYESLVDDATTASPDEAGTNGDPLHAARRRQEQRIRHAIAERLPLNPTSDLWRFLLLRGCPFLKRELLRENPTRVPDLWDWRLVLAEISEIDSGMILADLARSARNRAP